MPDRLPCIYIAGAYRAPTPWQITENIHAARLLSLAVWKLGAVALCPHANTALFDGEADDAIWLEGDLELLRRCDAILMVPNWKQSQGASAEWRFAKAQRLATFSADQLKDGQLKEWIDAWKETRRSRSVRRAAAHRT